MTALECGTIGDLLVRQAATRDAIRGLLDHPSERTRDTMRDQVVALLAWEQTLLPGLVARAGADQAMTDVFREQHDRLRAELNAVVWSPVESVEFWQAVRRLGEVLVEHIDLSERMLSR